MPPEDQNDPAQEPPDKEEYEKWASDSGFVCEDKAPTDMPIVEVAANAPFHEVTALNCPIIRDANVKGYTVRKFGDGRVEYLHDHNKAEWLPYPPKPKKNYPQGAANLGYNIELRDVFAAHAIEHSLADMWNMLALDMQKTGFSPSKERVSELLRHSAQNAYMVADALIAARENVGKP